MNRWVFGLAAVLMMAGCNPGKAGGGSAKREPVTEAGFVKKMGVEPIPAMDWSAQDYLGAQPPMDGMLIDAMADPFAADADWLKPEKKADRAAMAKKLDAWWEATQKPGAAKLSTPEVTSQFGVVVSARLLRGRLMAADGNVSGAMDLAVETMETARQGFMTAPGMAASDLMPTVVIAAEGLAKIAAMPGVTDVQMRKALAAMDFSIYKRIGEGAKEDFFANQLPVLISRLNRADTAVAVCELVDPMGDSDKPVAQIEAALAGGSGIVNEECAQEAKALLARYEESPPNYGELAILSRGVQDRLVGAWGTNLFEERPESWPKDMKGAVGKSKDAVGDLYLAAIERGWLTSIESSTMMQFSLDGARLSVMELQAKGQPVNTSVLVDPLSGGNYKIDMKGRMLRTILTEVDPKFIFANQIVQNGVRY